MRKGGDGYIDRLQMMREIKRKKLTDKTGRKGHRETGVERETGRQRVKDGRTNGSKNRDGKDNRGKKANRHHLSALIF